MERHHGHPVFWLTFTTKLSCRRSYHPLPCLLCEIIKKKKQPVTTIITLIVCQSTVSDFSSSAIVRQIRYAKSKVKIQ